MISILLTTVLAFAQTAAAPVQTGVDNVQKLGLYEIEDLINVQLERQRELHRRLTLDLMTMALTSGSDQVSGLEKLPLLSAVALMGAAGEEGQTADPAQLPPSKGLDLAALLMDPEQGGQPFQSADDLLEHVQTFMQPPFDKHVNQLVIERHGNARVLLANLSTEQHKWTEGFLNMQRSRGGWQAMVHARLYVGDPALMKRLELDAGAGLPLSNSGEINAMCERFSAANFDLLTSPKVLANPGQESEVLVQNQMSYLADWSVVTIYPGPTEIADPEIKVLSEGMKMKSRVLQVGANQYGLDINIEYAKVKQPIPTRTIQISGQDLEISMPELRTSQIETTLILPSGGGALFRLPNEASPANELFLIVEFMPVKLN